MWMAPMFALIGVALGLAFEPLRVLIMQRGRNRQVLVDRCVEVVSHAELARRAAVGLNWSHRRLRDVSRYREQINGEVRAYNEARRGLSTAIALLRLSGPDDLADAGDAIADAVEALHQVTQAPDDDLSHGEQTVSPRVVREAEQAVADALRRFSIAARPFTRPTGRRLRFRRRRPSAVDGT